MLKKSNCKGGRDYINQTYSNCINSIKKVMIKLTNEITNLC